MVQDSGNNSPTAGTDYNANALREFSRSIAGRISQGIEHHLHC